MQRNTVRFLPGTATNALQIVPFQMYLLVLMLQLFYSCVLISCILSRPLQRMVAGMVLGGLAFLVAGFVQLKVQSADDTLGAMEAKVVFTNGVQDPGQLMFQYEGQVPFNLSHGMVSWGICGRACLALVSCGLISIAVE